MTIRKCKKTYVAYIRACSVFTLTSSARRRYPCGPRQKEEQWTRCPESWSWSCFCTNSMWPWISHLTILYLRSLWRRLFRGFVKKGGKKKVRKLYSYQMLMFSFSCVKCQTLGTFSRVQAATPSWYLGEYIEGTLNLHQAYSWMEEYRPRKAGSSFFLLWQTMIIKPF